MRCPACDQTIVVTKAGEGPYPNEVDVAECGGEGDGCCGVAFMAFEYAVAIQKGPAPKWMTFADYCDVDFVMSREEAAAILYAFACAHIDADKEPAHA